MNFPIKVFLGIIMIIFPYAGIVGQTLSDIIIETETFDVDPEWENYHNRVSCSDCPEINQDFGWRPTNNNSSGVGEIGGMIWRSTTPSYYAMPLGKFLTFKEAFSASGKISVIAPEDEGFGFYFGFFNAERQGWRVWSSCGVRIGKMKKGIQTKDAEIGRFHLDYKTGQASGAILNPDLAIPGDGSVHDWELKYEPKVTVAEYAWPDSRLPGLFPKGKTNIHTDILLKSFQEIEPSMTKEKLLNLLFEARDNGLVDDWYRKGKYHLWNLELEPEKIKGKITFTFSGSSSRFHK